MVILRVLIFSGFTMTLVADFYNLFRLFSFCIYVLRFSVYYMKYSVETLCRGITPTCFNKFTHIAIIAKNRKNDIDVINLTFSA